MIKSMTGYGLVQGKVGERRVVVETKSVNHKFCEVNLRLSQRFSVLEGKIAEAAKAFFSRGRIDILVREEAGQTGEGASRIDAAKLKQYHQQLKTVAKALKAPSDFRIESFLVLPDIVVSEEAIDLDKMWRDLEALLKKSFIALEKMRGKEGLGIAQFFKEQISELSREVTGVEKLVPGNIEHHREQLQERVNKLTNGMELDAQRLAQEVAYFVDRTDISEELQRLKHHIVHFEELVREAGPLGRKLDFLLQEMNREANTLSAKAQNAQISQKVVNCKHCLEKIREQVQNVE